MKQELACGRIEWTGKKLRASTGCVSRVWRLTTCGLKTVSFMRDSTSSTDEPHEWITNESAQDDSSLCDFDCDWRLSGFGPDMSNARVVDVNLTEKTECIGTSDHIEGTVELAYDEANLGLLFTVYVYPGAAGIRTRLSLKLLRSVSRDRVPGALENSTVETLDIHTNSLVRIAAGYYNDTQHRNHDDTPILKEERQTGEIGPREIYDWTNLLTLRKSSGEGMIVVKESHKCVNQSGLDTGAFILERGALRVTGLGLNNAAYDWYQKAGSHNLDTTYVHCWPTWSLLFTGSWDDASLALKKFDRIRFAPIEARDMKIRANTWGTRFAPGRGATDAATEDNMRAEIDSCVDLGIEMATIDAGWDASFPSVQSGLEETPFRPHPDRFPEGWGAIRSYALEHGVSLGLHFSVGAPLEDLIRNYEEGAFSAYKLDYGAFTSKRQFDELIKKTDVLRRMGCESLRISWDLTENPPRVGYFTAREYGTLYPSNRREPGITRVGHVAYTPRLVLRDAWHFAHYLNLNQIEITVQDPTRIDPRYSNAGEYSCDYCAAIAFFGLPLFFMETQVFTEESRLKLRPLLSAYKKHRPGMYRGFVFPVGDEPNDASWTGFQSVAEDGLSGYLILFRECRNTDVEKCVQLRFLDGQFVLFEDCLSGRSWDGYVESSGAMNFEMTDAGSYLFLRYRCVS